MPTLEEIREYLGIDWEDAATDRRLTRLSSVADKYFIGGLGEGYPAGDPRVHELALIVIGQLYDNIDVSNKVSSSIEKLIADFSLQIRLEMRAGDSEI